MDQDTRRSAQSLVAGSTSKLENFFLRRYVALVGLDENLKDGSYLGPCIRITSELGVGDIQPLVTFHERKSSMEVNLGQKDFAFPILHYICGKEILVEEFAKSTEGYNWEPTPIPGVVFLIEYDGTVKTDAEIFKKELLTPSQSNSSSDSSDSDEGADLFGNTPRRRRRSMSSGGSDSRWNKKIRNEESSESEEDWEAVVRRERATDGTTSSSKGEDSEDSEGAYS
jgi:hypothetical protein